MSEKMKMKKDKQNFIFISVILFLVLSCSLLINAVVNNSQADWAIVPDIKLVGEYKIGDGEWKDIVEGEHIPATKGDVMLKGVLKICDPKTNEPFETVEKGSLMLFTFNHINLTVTENNQTIYVCDTENPVIGEDLCGRTCTVVEYTGEDGCFEATIRNYHKFGNETAVDEMLSSMKLYASDYSEKIALRSGQNERLIAILIILTAFIVLGIAIFLALFYKDISVTTLLCGLLILSAGVFFLVTSKAFYFWFDKVVVNTMMTEISVMTYVLCAFVLIKKLFSEKTQKIAYYVTVLYGVFISVLVTVSLLSKIYFYDMIGVCAVGSVIASAVFCCAGSSFCKKCIRQTKDYAVFGNCRSCAVYS